MRVIASGDSEGENICCVTSGEVECASDIPNGPAGYNWCWIVSTEVDSFVVTDLGNRSSD